MVINKNQHVAENVHRETSWKVVTYLLTYLLGQDFACFYGNWRFLSVFTDPPIDPILYHFNPVHNLTP